MKVSSDEQNPEGTLGLGEKGRGKGPGGLQRHSHVASPPSLWSSWSESFNNVKKLRWERGLRKGDREGKDLHAESEGQRAWRVWVTWWWKRKEPGVGTKAETSTQHAGDLDLPEVCTLNASAFSSALFLLHFLRKVALAAPSKEHPDPLGTGRHPPKRKICEPRLLQCRNVALPKKWWGWTFPRCCQKKETTGSKIYPLGLTSSPL